MIQLTASETTLLNELRFFAEPVEITDASGKLLGLFVPANLERGQRPPLGLDAVEIQRRQLAQEGWLTTEQVLQHLAALEAECHRRETAGEKALTREDLGAFLKALRQQTAATPEPEGKKGCATP
jgi:hypothetical protein